MKTISFCFSIPSQKIGKPNEDYPLIDTDRDIYILCDGISRSIKPGVRYPNPSPSSIVSKLFAHSVHEYLLDSILNKNSIRKCIFDSIQHGNSKVKEWNNSNLNSVDYLSSDLAGTVCIGAIILDDTLFYFHIGDCYGIIVYDDNSIVVFGEPQTKHVKEYRDKFGFDDQITIKIRRDFRNNANSEYSYGAITGESSAINFLEYGYFSLSQVSKILLLSDGIDTDIENIVQATNLVDIQEKINNVVNKEIRNLNLGDDKTIIQIAIK